MGLLKFIKKLLPYHCKECGESLDKLVFEELPQDIKTAYNQYPKERVIIERYGYICKPCDKHYLIMCDKVVSQFRCNSSLK